MSYSSMMVFLLFEGCNPYTPPCSFTEWLFVKHIYISLCYDYSTLLLSRLHSSLKLCFVSLQIATSMRSFIVLCSSTLYYLSCDHCSFPPGLVNLHYHVYHHHSYYARYLWLHLTCCIRYYRYLAWSCDVHSFVVLDTFLFK